MKKRIAGANPGQRGVDYFLMGGGGGGGGVSLFHYFSQNHYNFTPQSPSVIVLIFYELCSFKYSFSASRADCSQPLYFSAQKT